MRVTLRRWGPDDMPVLERSNTPEMTAHLGGPESRDELQQRHERYLRLGKTGEAHMFRIDVDDVPAGSIGWWQTDHDGARRVRDGMERLPGVAGPGRRGSRASGADPASWPPTGTATCWSPTRASTTHRRTRCADAPASSTPGSSTEPWRGGQLTFNIWVLDMSPLDLDDRVPDHDERFDGEGLDETRWWPYYTPHWSSREAIGGPLGDRTEGLTLRIDADTPPWSPQYDGEVRASHLQTGQFSGPVGSAIGQHRFRDGLVVQEEQPEQRLWLPRFGVIDVRLRAIRHPDAMVAFWPIGFEDRPEDCGEICVCEIFGSELDDTGGWVGVGVKPQRDPRLTLDFEKIRVEGDLTEFHDYAVEWDEDRVRFFIDGRWVKTVAQRIDYPVQLMLDVYELPNESGTRDVSAHPLRFDVERVRTFPPR